MSLDLELGGFGPDPFGGVRAGFTAIGEIKRSDFGPCTLLGFDQ